MTDEEKTVQSIPLDTKTQEIADRIIQEEDADKIRDLTHLFNLNQAKKNVLRVMKLNSLLDKVSDTMIDRFEKRPGEFSNKDLLDYMQVTQNQIDRANKSLDIVKDAPAISFNQNNQVNIIADGLDRESKGRVADAIKAILQRVDEQNLGDVVDGRYEEEDRTDE